MTKAIILSITLSAISLALIASSSANTHSISDTGSDFSCAQEIWPAFSQDCLLTIQGQKSFRKFRVINY